MAHLRIDLYTLIYDKNFYPAVKGYLLKVKDLDRCVSLRL